MGLAKRLHTEVQERRLTLNRAKTILENWHERLRYKSLWSGADRHDYGRQNSGN